MTDNPYMLVCTENEGQDNRRIVNRTMSGPDAAEFIKAKAQLKNKFGDDSLLNIIMYKVRKMRSGNELYDIIFNSELDAVKQFESGEINTQDLLWEIEW